METSDSIAALATALAKAQGKITGALKDSANPFFKSKYADLASVWDACREQLSANGLAVIQTTDLDPDGVTVITTLAHSSGEWIRGRLRMMPTKNDPQGIGSCLTYARRYALAAIVGVAQVDDDGNAASVHDPRGEIRVDPKAAQAAAGKMLDAVELDADEDARALAVMDVHDSLRGDNDLYIAAGDLAATKFKGFKAAWKSYMARGKALDNQPAANGRAA